MILVLGEILFDIFPDYRRIGGAPFNFAFHLKQLGFEVAFVSRVGKDALGEKILSFVSEKGLDPGYIQVDDDHATGTVDIAVTADGDHRFSIVPDRAYDHLEWNKPLEALCAGKPQMVYFGTLIQRSPRGRAIVDQALRACPDALRFCDINLRPDCWTQSTAEAAMARAQILKLNIEELDILVPPADRNPALRAGTLLAPGVPAWSSSPGEKKELSGSRTRGHNPARNRHTPPRRIPPGRWPIPWEPEMPMPPSLLPDAWQGCRTGKPWRWPNNLQGGSARFRAPCPRT